MFAFSEIMAGGSTFNSALKQIENEQAAAKAKKLAEEHDIREDEISKMHSEEKFVIKAEDEDCHTAIENYLIEKFGDVGKKIHTARSRNDQSMVALRLLMKDKLKKDKKSKHEKVKKKKTKKS